MMAAAATEPDPALVQLLIEKGADVGARDDGGRTALDWALLQGDTAAAQALTEGRRRGRRSAEWRLRPQSACPRSPRAAVEAALARLQPAGPKFLEGGKCISCHHQTLPSIAVALASARGATVDTAVGSPSTIRRCRRCGGRSGTNCCSDACTGSRSAALSERPATRWLVLRKKRRQAASSPMRWPCASPHSSVRRQLERR